MGPLLPRYAPIGDYRTRTRYPPSPSSDPHSLTIPGSSPCNSVFMRPRSTGPPGEPFPFPVMMWTTAAGLRRLPTSADAAKLDRQLEKATERLRGGRHGFPLCCPEPSHEAQLDHHDGLR